MLFFKAVYWSFAIVAFLAIGKVAQFVAGAVGSVAWEIVDKPGKEEYLRVFSVNPSMSVIFVPKWVKVLINIVNVLTFVFLLACIIYLYFVLFP